MILPEFGADKGVFHQTVGAPFIRWIHHDSIYVRFGGMKSTKTWGKSRLVLKSHLLLKWALKDNIKAQDLVQGPS